MFFKPMQSEPFDLTGQFFQRGHPVLPGEPPKFHQERHASSTARSIALFREPLHILFDRGTDPRRSNAIDQIWTDEES